MTTKILTALAALAAAACARDSRPATPTTSPPPGATTMQGPSAGMTQPGPGMHGGMHGADEHTAFLDPGASASRPVSEAVAVIYSMTDGRRVGTVRFMNGGAQGLDVVTSVEGLPAGVHAYHVHVYGDCSSADAKSAGPHFHFTGSSLDESVKIITGNLGELKPDGEGRVQHRTHLAEARLHGNYSIIGRSVVIHEKGNDPSVTPDGGAGARIACGVIGVANPTAPSSASAQR